MLHRCLTRKKETDEASFENEYCETINVLRFKVIAERVGCMEVWIGVQELISLA